MNVLGKRCSSWVVWGMIPLAVWGGMPSTACVCANGRIKLFCGHRCGADHHHGGPALANSYDGHSNPYEGHRSDDGYRQACCCGEVRDEQVARSEGAQEYDCCNSEVVGGLPGQGVSSRGGCTPIGSLVATLPSEVKAPAPVEKSPATPQVATGLFHGGYLTASPSSFDSDTGPPVDLVVTLGRFLI